MSTPSLNSSIRSILIAIGAGGVAKGWWDQEGLETLVDQLIVWGGATLVIGSAIWGVWAKRAESREAVLIAAEVLAIKRVADIKAEAKSTK